MNTKYYLKFLEHDRMPAYGGVGQWPEVGVWTEEVDPIPCRQGWHLCRKQDIFYWTYETLWVVEAEGVVVDPKENNKVVARRARLVRQVAEWGPRNQRLFAADCAERVLHYYEAKYPNDNHPRKAIETARRFARGEATEQELDTAGSAASYAAGSATWSALDAARHAAWSATEATYASAWSAARFAADAAWSAAGSAADASTERNWQISHLFKEYLKLDPNDFH